MLGERIPAAAGARVGPDQPRRAPTTTSPAEVDALRDAAGRRADALLRRRPSASSTHWLYARMDEQLELEADDPAGDGGLGGLRRGRRGLRREAPAGVRGAVSAPPTCRRPPGCEYNPRALARTPCHPLGRVASPAPCLVALAALLAFAGAAFADALTPESGRLAERRRDRHALQARLRRRAGHLRRRRGRAALLAGQVPRAQGRRRRPDPRQHAAGGRLDGRRRADPRRARRRHVRQAPAASATRRTPAPTACQLGRQRRARRLGPAKKLPPNGKSLNICVNGQQYIWRYTYARTATNDAARTRLLLQGDGRPGRTRR